MAADRGAAESYPCYLQAIGRLQLGDTAGYRQTCTDMLGRFGRTDSPGLANDVAWGCVLAPEAVADLAPVVGLATKATKAPHARASFCNTLGAALYRASQSEAARTYLLESLRLSSGGVPADWVFLAMVCHRQGHQAEARRWLDKLVRWRDASWHTPGANGPLISALRLTEIDLLHREAEALLAGGQK